MMRKITLIAALMAASSLVAAPAAAQNATPPQPEAAQTATEHLFAILLDLSRINDQHFDAAAECNRVEMERLKALAAPMAREPRQIINASRAAGAYSTINPVSLRDAERLLNASLREINSRQPTNCPTDADRPTVQVLPAPTAQPQPTLLSGRPLTWDERESPTWQPTAPVPQQAPPSPPPVEGESILDNLDETPRLSDPVPPPPVQPADQTGSQLTGSQSLQGEPTTTQPSQPPAPVQPQSAQAEALLREADRQRVAAQQRFLVDGDQILLNSEEALRAGRCEEGAQLLRAASIFLDRIEGSFPEGDSELEALRERMGALHRLPCPPPPRAPEPVNRVGAVGLSLGAGYGEAAIPRANYGFVRDGPAGSTPEVPAEQSERRSPVFVFEGAARFRGIGILTLGYREGDASNRIDIPAGPVGTARGFPYTATSPSGSAGIAGNVPLLVTTEVSVREFSGGFRTNLFGLDDDLWQEARAEEQATRNDPSLRGPTGGVNVSVGADVIYRERDHAGTVSITTPVIATQTLDQRINEVEIALVGGVSTMIPVGTGARVTIGAEIAAYYYDFDLRSLETVTQNFGPVADRAFETLIRDSVNGVGYRGEISAELAVDVALQFQFFLNGTARLHSDRAQLRNPPNGDFVFSGGTSLVGTRSAADWIATAGFHFYF